MKGAKTFFWLGFALKVFYPLGLGEKKFEGGGNVFVAPALKGAKTFFFFDAALRGFLCPGPEGWKTLAVVVGL